MGGDGPDHIIKCIAQRCWKRERMLHNSRVSARETLLGPSVSTGRFIRNVLKAPDPKRRTEATILNRWTRDGIGPIDACAFLRHVYGCFYRDFTLVDTAGRQFTPIYTFERLLHNFRSAVLRYGEGIRRFHTRRRGTSLKQDISKADRERFPGLIQIDEASYTYSLAHGFRNAIKQAEDEANTRREQNRKRKRT